MAETLNLPVKLTEQELIIKGNELSVLLGGLDDLETRKANSNDGFKSELKKVGEKISEVARIVREKKEYRDVEVEHQKNFERMTMDTIRLDTGEVVSYRELQGHERNLGLFPRSIDNEDGAGA